MKTFNLAAFWLLLVPATAFAVPVTYQVVTTGEISSLNGGPSSSAPITFVATADTANLREQVGVPTGSKYGTVYLNIDTIPLQSLTVTIGGLPTATFLSPPSLEYAYAEEIAFTNIFPQGVAYSFYSVPTPPTTPDIIANATTAPIILPNFAFYGSAATDLGTLTVGLSPIGYITTLSVTLGTSIPEPSSAALMSVGLVGLMSIALSARFAGLCNRITAGWWMARRRFVPRSWGRKSARDRNAAPL